jgi:hypothetical protein
VALGWFESVDHYRMNRGTAQRFSGVPFSGIEHARSVTF